MPLALLLSPDDQAVSAITAVLEEMSVTCERPLDGVSAAKQLSSQNFDLVMVDCENLPAAKLIFDVCRRGKNGKNPVPIAIVDGRAGLPTAFRLGAELILTKPVSKDQARTTVRTAVTRVKKEQPSMIPQTTSPADEIMPQTLGSTSETAENAIDSGELTAPVSSLPEGTHALVGATLGQASPVAGSAAAEVSLAAGTMTTAAAAKLAPEAESEAQTARVLDEPKHAPAPPPSDDPVLADLERTESKPETAVELAGSRLLASTSVLGLTGHAEKQDEPTNKRKPLLGLVAVALVCVGFYAAWMTQPGFRSLVQQQFDRVLALAGKAKAVENYTPSIQAKPTAATAPSASPPESEPSEARQPPQLPAADGTVALPTTGTTVTAQGGAGNTASQAASSGTPGPNATSAGAPAASPSKSVSDKASANSNAAKPNDGDITIALPGGSSKAGSIADSVAVVLSSKAAEKRLIHSVLPSYKGAAAGGSEGTVVLKAVVDENGKVDGAQVVEGNAALAESAVNAVKQWRYRPYIRDGKAVAFQTIVLVDFSQQ